MWLVRCARCRSPASWWWARRPALPAAPSTPQTLSSSTAAPPPSSWATEQQRQASCCRGVPGGGQATRRKEEGGAVRWYSLQMTPSSTSQKTEQPVHCCNSGWSNTDQCRGDNLLPLHVFDPNLECSACSVALGGGSAVRRYSVQMTPTNVGMLSGGNHAFLLAATASCDRRSTAHAALLPPGQAAVHLQPQAGQCVWRQNGLLQVRYSL